MYYYDHDPRYLRVGFTAPGWGLGARIPSGLLHNYPFFFFGQLSSISLMQNMATSNLPFSISSQCQRLTQHFKTNQNKSATHCVLDLSLNSQEQLEWSNQNLMSHGKQSPRDR